MPIPSLSISVAIRMMASRRDFSSSRPLVGGSLYFRGKQADLPHSSRASPHVNSSEAFVVGAGSFERAEYLVDDRSLRRSIERGLARSRYGVVALSAHFFRKEWPQKELDTLVTKETSKLGSFFRYGSI